MFLMEGVTGVEIGTAERAEKGPGRPGNRRFGLCQPRTL
ncbi:hypothetical protein DVDV_2757 [Desulfovibrio sp. DV]|nr:hypothetical protein DVDV_2757 [Desulfovibrio sp. DV]